MPTGCTLNYHGDGGSCIPWHRDDEHIFRNIHSSKGIVTVSLGIESQLHEEAPWGAEFLEFLCCCIMETYWLWMGLRKKEFDHSTLPGLQGPRTNLHVQVDCPNTFQTERKKMLECVCVLQSCMQGLSVPDSCCGGGCETNVMDVSLGGPP